LHALVFNVAINDLCDAAIVEQAKREHLCHAQRCHRTTGGNYQRHRPAHTAAIFVTYSSVTNGIEGTTVALDGVKIIPSANANYVLNGVYLNDATNVWVHDFQETGKVTSFDNTTSGIVYDGTHSPTNLHVLDSYFLLVGKGSMRRNGLLTDGREFVCKDQILFTSKVQAYCSAH
jgi:hypothetical protein